MKIHIKGGTLVDPAAGTQQTADVYLAAGKVAAIGAAPADFHAAKTIDAAGLVVAPGLVDLSARLREPGNEHRATLESEMAAAVAGGVTSLVCPPDTDPVLDEPGLVEMLKFRASKLHQAHVYPLGALTVGLRGEVITEMVELTESGCIGFTQANVPIRDTQVLLRALQYASTYGFTVWLRPLDAFLAKGGVAASGAVASRLGLSGVPVSAETIALHTLFELMRVTGARVHVARLSSAAGIALVREAKAEGLAVSCDVSANHLHLIDVDIGYFDAQFRLDPPLRAERDREAIRAGVADGTIDAICSDHTPVDDDEKLLPFAEATPGATGLELLLSLTVKWANEANLPLAQALSRITSAPADVLKLPAGRLAPGAVADLVVFDPAAHWQVEPRALKSQGHNSPFLGYELPAQVRVTIVAGQLAFERR
ncbi:dihydroorotase [Burkholderia glumae]|uniref:Dihydroorotase n=1 Tax=Burkholderia glumae TaxID=337 RepID=A0AAQ0BVN2_BURGL|nr:dihydroorotase [Burkholderia glumae]ACR27915.1 dihydroorotase [Burkholderia glumae BGR1]AJY67615.1 dihydroorotase [Burkholderia glumae LMG 2196 = ATCC 33617]KHJ62064.1 dihydroorotase [Burkholderia glumae]MCM2481107.1 dihydroorotase [Burkholderia glumae]MCM2508754.1 dihydroorotase [Burkholderia glumae]